MVSSYLRFKDKILILKYYDSLQMFVMKKHATNSSVAANNTFLQILCSADWN